MSAGLVAALSDVRMRFIFGKSCAEMPFDFPVFQ
jgi:hypothetical protein